VPLASDVEALVARGSGVVGVYARHLGSGETVAVDADRVLPAESAAKTFVLVHYAGLVRRGDADPTGRVPLRIDPRPLGTGVLRYLADGLEPTLDDLAWLMIIVSDNVATALLLQEVGGPAAVNATMDELGYPTARLNETITLEGALAGEPFSSATPRDLAEVYTELDDRARAILFRQQHLIGLPRRLPFDVSGHASDVGIRMPVRVFTKTGNGIGNFIDSGLFETDDARWVVAAMATEQPDFAVRADDEAPRLFAELGARLYEAWGPPDPA